MLNDIKCKNAKAQDAPYKLADSGGLYMLIKPNGTKLWRVKYRHLGKEKLLSIGVYPLITLAEAREARDKAKKLLISGTDPMVQKKKIIVKPCVKLKTLLKWLRLSGMKSRLIHGAKCMRCM